MEIINLIVKNVVKWDGFLNYFTLFILSMFISLFLTPLFMNISFKFDFLDIPKEERKVHKAPMPFLGGIIVYISFLVTLTIQTSFLDRVHFVIIVSSTLILIGGIIDDIYPMKPKGKLLIQIIAISILIFNDIYIKNISLFPGGNKLSFGVLGIPLMFGWVILVTNSFNLIDGLDGLAAGVSFIVSGAIFIISLISKNFSSALVSSVLCGTLLGILPYNSYKAKIFIGDSGSQFIGFILSVISISGFNNFDGEFLILIPIVVCGLPLFDALTSIIRRKINKKPIMQADKGHVHHKLISFGNSHPKAVIIMYLLSFVFSFIAILMTIADFKLFIFLIFVCIIFLVILISILDVFGLKNKCGE